MRAGTQQLYMISEILFGFSGAGIAFTVFLGIRFRIWQQIRTDREENAVMGQVNPVKKRRWKLFAKEKYQDIDDAEEASPCRDEENTADLVSDRATEEKILAEVFDSTGDNVTEALGADAESESETVALSYSWKTEGR
ncbi:MULTISPECIES: hypothetical protein [unclassified Bilifractor]|uniref:hypothetical protein n=1 Tax=unclassified Bilifractor TaxID=2815795 RepID=UPI003F92C1D9